MWFVASLVGYITGFCIAVGMSVSNAWLSLALILGCGLLFGSSAIVLRERS